jgi:hypothetical protein
MTEQAMAERLAQVTRKRVVVAVRPDKVISWDHRKLARAAG